MRKLDKQVSREQSYLSTNNLPRFSSSPKFADLNVQNQSFVFRELFSFHYRYYFLPFPAYTLAGQRARECRALGEKSQRHRARENVHTIILVFSST